MQMGENSRDTRSKHVIMQPYSGMSTSFKAGVEKAELVCSWDRQVWKYCPLWAIVDDPSEIMT